MNEERYRIKLVGMSRPGKITKIKKDKRQKELELSTLEQEAHYLRHDIKIMNKMIKELEAFGEKLKGE